MMELTALVAVQTTESDGLIEVNRAIMVCGIVKYDQVDMWLLAR